MNDPLIYLTSLFVLGIAAQWLAWRSHLPAILLLLGFGFVVGAFSDAQSIIQDDLLFPFVSLSVAVILFDGGLSLKFSELKETSHVVIRLITIGCLITWALGTLASSLIFSDWRIAALAGAIFTVTGPTVVGPLLRQIRPIRSVGSIAKWEGIVIDPIGAVLAVFVYQAIASEQTSGFIMHLLVTVIMTASVAILIGVVAGWILLFLFRNHWVPDYLQSPILLASVIACFTLSNLIQPEAGLATVTLLGILLANQKSVAITHLIEFKENLGILLISVLFILLASRMEWESVVQLGWKAAIFLCILIFLIRPIAIFLSTIGTGLPRNQKIFLAWLAPRGIVAAAVASVFSLELSHLAAEGHLNEEVARQANLLVPLTFLTIVVTVTIYGLTASPLARKLGLSESSPQGILFAGADRLVRMIAIALQNEGFSVHVVDTNHNNVSAARMAGLPTTTASILSEYVHEEIDLGGIGRMIAMTPNDQVNTLAALECVELFGRSGVFQATPEASESQRKTEGLSSKHARYVFEDGTTRAGLAHLIEQGYIVKTTKLSDEFDYDQFKELYQNKVTLMFVLDSNGSLAIRTDANETKPKPGQSIITLVPKTEEPTA